MVHKTDYITLSVTSSILMLDDDEKKSEDFGSSYFSVDPENAKYDHVMTAFIYFMSFNNALPVCRGFIEVRVQLHYQESRGMDEHTGA